MVYGLLTTGSPGGQKRTALSRPSSKDTSPAGAHHLRSGNAPRQPSGAVTQADNRYWPGGPTPPIMSACPRAAMIAVRAVLPALAAGIVTRRPDLPAAGDNHRPFSGRSCGRGPPGSDTTVRSPAHRGHHGCAGSAVPGRPAGAAPDSPARFLRRRPPSPRRRAAGDPADAADRLAGRGRILFPQEKRDGLRHPCRGCVFPVPPGMIGENGIRYGFPRP